MLRGLGGEQRAGLKDEVPSRWQRQLTIAARDGQVLRKMLDICSKVCKGRLKHERISQENKGKLCYKSFGNKIYTETESLLQFKTIRVYS